MRGEQSMGVSATVWSAVLVLSTISGCHTVRSSSRSKYLYTPQSTVSPFADGQSIQSLAVYPIDDAFEDGLLDWEELSKGRKTNLELSLATGNAHLLGKTRDYYSYTLYQELNDQPWIQRVDFGPDPSEDFMNCDTDAFYDFVLTGSMEYDESGNGGAAQLILTLSSPLDPTFVRRHRTWFTVPAIVDEVEYAPNVTFQSVNSNVMAWLRAELSTVDPQRVALRRTEFIAQRVRQLDPELSNIAAELVAALKEDATPERIRALLLPYSSRWSILREVVHEDIERQLVHVEAAAAANSFDRISAKAADVYHERDKQVAEVRRQASAAKTGARLQFFGALMLAAAAGAAQGYQSGQAAQMGQTLTPAQTANYQQMIMASTLLATNATERMREIEAELELLNTSADISGLAVDVGFDPTRSEFNKDVKVCIDDNKNEPRAIYQCVLGAYKTHFGGDTCQQILARAGQTELSRFDITD